MLLPGMNQQPPDNIFFSQDEHPESLSNSGGDVPQPKTSETNITDSKPNNTISDTVSDKRGNPNGDVNSELEMQSEARIKNAREGEEQSADEIRSSTYKPSEDISTFSENRSSQEILSEKTDDNSSIQESTTNRFFAELPNIEEQLSSDKDSDEPFAHAKYGFAAVVSIYLMYQFAGGALHSLARNRSAAFETVLQGLGQVLFMLIPAILVMRYSPLKVQGLMRSGGQVSAAQWLLGLVGVFGIQIFDAGFITVQERLVPSFFLPVYQQLRMWSDMVEQFYRTSFAGTTPFEAVRALLIGAVVPAFAEEVLFRGVLQRSLESVYPVRRAIVITAILFGILHFNPLSLVPLILIGAYLGFLAYYTQSLALPIVAHFLSNAIAIVALYAPGQGLEMSPFGFSIGRGLLLLSIGAVIFVGAIILIRRFTPQVPPVSVMSSSSAS